MERDVPNSETFLYALGALAVKLSKCPSWQRPAIKQNLVKLHSIYQLQKEKETTVISRRFWVREIFTEEQRWLQGASNNLIELMRRSDREKFHNFLRMSPETFDKLLCKVEHFIKKRTVIREPLEPKLRLEITLRYLASGDTMVSLSYYFRIGKQTVSTIIAETCEAIWRSLKEEVFVEPNAENWKGIARNFELKWHFKNCLGSIDGKHVIIQALPKSGSNYYNYKGMHSINLMAIADAHYKFIMVDIGAPGRLSDSGVFRRSAMGQGFEQNLFNIPPPEDNMPYVLVGDEAFPLTYYLMRPYSRRGNLDLTQKVFNYRLSRARRVVENAFGILVAKWRIFRKPIHASEATIRKIVKACICLHNFLLSQKTESDIIINPDEELVSTTEGLLDIGSAGSNTFSQEVGILRNKFKDYFCGPGATEWQWEKALNNDY